MVHPAVRFLSLATVSMFPHWKFEGAVTHVAPDRPTHAELPSERGMAVGAVNVTMIGAAFGCPAANGPVLVTVMLVIAAA